MEFEDILALSYLGRRLLKKRIITTEGHWLWSGTISKEYAQISIDDKTKKVCRVVAQLCFDNFDDKLFVLHKPSCNIKECWNPEHLYQGTQKQNINDQMIAGTFVSNFKDRIW